MLTAWPMICAGSNKTNEENLRRITKTTSRLLGVTLLAPAS